jgi:hypothetical protein
MSCRYLLSVRSKPDSESVFKNPQPIHYFHGAKKGLHPLKFVLCFAKLIHQINKLYDDMCVVIARKCCRVI